MPTPFADFEARVNAAVAKHLANATATIGGQPVDGVFHNDYAAADGLGGFDPAFEAIAAALPGVVRGTPVTVNGTAYQVRLREDDGTGWSVLRLEKP